MAAKTPSSAWLDRVAVGASALCLVHCLALPLLIAALPALGDFARGSWVHWSLLAFAVPTSLWALTRDAEWRASLAIGATGLTLMAVGVARFEGTPAERWLTVAGVLLVAAAHVRRWVVRQRHHRPHAAAGAGHA